MELLLLVLLIVFIKSFPVSGSTENTVQQRSTPSNHQAFSWDLNESYKQSDAISKNPEKDEEEYTSTYHDPNLILWGKKRKRNTETRPKKDLQQQIELSTIIPKKRKTLITKPRWIDEDEQDKLLKMVNTKKGRGKGKFYRARGENTCNPHTPSCKHWDDLDDVQRKRERRKMRYYSKESNERERARESQRIVYNNLSPSEKIVRNRKQYEGRKKFLRNLKPDERREWYDKKAEKERERKQKIRMGLYNPKPRNKLQVGKKKKGKRIVNSSSESE